MQHSITYLRGEDLSAIETAWPQLDPRDTWEEPGDAERAAVVEEDAAEAAQLRAEEAAEVAAERTAEHYEVSARTADEHWPACIECACGTILEGFNTLTEARDELAQHITDATTPGRHRAPEADVDPVARPVTAEHVLEMAERAVFSCRERALALAGHPAAKLTYEQAVRRNDRQMLALRRLVRALERQAYGSDQYDRPAPDVGEPVPADVDGHPLGRRWVR